MTKQELQKELKEKVQPGVKPSDLRRQSKGDDLKKLKRSKSADDIPSSPLQSVPLTKSQSNPPLTAVKYPYTQLVSQTQEIDKLKKETQAKSDTIKLLRDKIERLEKSPPGSLLQDQ